MVEKAAAAAAGAGDRKGGKRRTGKPETFLLACHHQQTVPSSTAEAHHLSGHGSACFNPRFGEAGVVGMGSKPTWVTKGDLLRKQPWILSP